MLREARFRVQTRRGYAGRSFAPGHRVCAPHFAALEQDLPVTLATALGRSPVSALLAVVYPKRMPALAMYHR